MYIEFAMYIKFVKFNAGLLIYDYLLCQRYINLLLPNHCIYPIGIAVAHFATTCVAGSATAQSFGTYYKCHIQESNLKKNRLMYQFEKKIHGLGSMSIVTMQKLIYLTTCFHQKVSGNQGRYENILGILEMSIKSM
jgi:hypothetical protein